jgi:two-component system LytT family response regulator
VQQISSFIRLSYYIDNRFNKNVQQPAANHIIHTDRISIYKTNGIVLIIPIADLLWIEAKGNYTLLTFWYHKQYIKIKLCHQLHEWETLLKAHQFLRIHRSHVVNERGIIAIDNHQHFLIMKNDDEVAFSKSHHQQVNQLFIRFMAAD